MTAACRIERADMVLQADPDSRVRLSHHGAGTGGKRRGQENFAHLNFPVLSCVRLFLNAVAGQRLALPIHREPLDELRADNGNQRRAAARVLYLAPAMARDAIAVSQGFADQLLVGATRFCVRTTWMKTAARRRRGRTWHIARQ